MAEVGAVSVKVVPDADGFQRALKRQLATQRVAFQVGDASKAGKDGAKYALSFQRAANSLFKGWKPNIGSTKIVAMGAKHGAAYASAFKAAVGDIDIDVDLSFKNGIYMEEPFDEMVISGLYKNGILHLDDLSFTKEKSKGLHIDGIIPLKNNSERIAISMESSFSNLSLEFVHRFVPGFFNINGLAVIIHFPLP